MTTTHFNSHFTASLTTDPEIGFSEFAEIEILEGDPLGDDPESDADWTDKPGGEVILSASTTVRKDAYDDYAAQEAAQDLLADSGWRLAGNWQQSEHGYLAAVERA